MKLTEVQKSEIRHILNVFGLKATAGIKRLTDLSDQHLSFIVNIVEGKDSKILSCRECFNLDKTNGCCDSCEGFSEFKRK